MCVYNEKCFTNYVKDIECEEMKVFPIQGSGQTMKVK